MTQQADGYQDAPSPRFTVGQRVYIRQLDVFGRVDMIETPAIGPVRYHVVCEHPLPEYRHRFSAAGLQDARDMER
jgi:hypothetical protein